MRIAIASLVWSHALAAAFALLMLAVVVINMVVQERDGRE